MGRYSEPLAVELVALLGVRDGDRVLDVGCGPGALTRELVQRLGPAAVSAVDPSESFVTAVRTRIPGIDAHRAAAERLPFADDRFDCAVAQLVVHFMTDPVAGLAEMARVTRGRGLVAASVWDHTIAPVAESQRFIVVPSVVIRWLPSGENREYSEESPATPAWSSCSSLPAVL